jgi:SNF2 family DNA or RNA helicase
MRFHTEPFGPYQRDDFDRTKDHRTFAYFWEQGLGKSWLAINVARHNWEQERIDAVLITAPNGVHAAWIYDQFPAHLPGDFPWEGMVWWPTVARSHWADVRLNLRSFVQQRDKLLVLATSYHSFLQDRSFNVIRQFLEQRKVMWVLDESDDIGNPKAQWSRRILRLAPLATMRRIATGTPYKDGTPLAYWSQFHFLHPRILADTPTYKSFQMKYAEWWMRPVPGRPYSAMIPKKDPATGRQKFKHLDELETLIAQRAVRRTKVEVLPQLPEKLYDKIYVELSPKQQSTYDLLRDEALLDLGERGLRAIEMVMVQRLRLQQVACGFYPADGEEPEERIPGTLPRLEQTVDLVEKVPGQVIVWARFRMDIDLLVEEFRRRGIATARYDGKVADRERAGILEGFTRGDTKVLVGNQAALSRGHTFTNSSRAFFYSNYEKLLLRVQAEDRQHRIGTRRAVLYTDVLARDTVDELTVEALRAKQNVADYLMGRAPREWL